MVFPAGGKVCNVRDPDVVNTKTRELTWYIYFLQVAKCVTVGDPEAVNTKTRELTWYIYFLQVAKCVTVGAPEAVNTKTRARAPCVPATPARCACRIPARDASFSWTS